MTGIFISYSRKDSAIAQKLIKEFESIDLDVWVDWEDIPPAVGWLDQILRGIEQAEVFVFLISPDSIKSEVCNVELEHAHKNAKRIIPIVVRDVVTKEVVSILRDLNWIFIREQDEFNAGLEKVKVAINIDIEWLQEHRRLQVRALEWDRIKDPSLLLRGGDLRTAAKMIVVNEKKDPFPSPLQKLYIESSRRSERLRLGIYVSAAITLFIMVFLSLVALNQRQEALSQRQVALENEKIAQEARTEADRNAAIARAQKDKALSNENIAKAQRSAARAQIFQGRTGGVFTSTLLAIDSYQRNPSSEAESVLRKNISLLPIPIKQLEQEGAILHLEVSPDGTSFVATSEEGKACLITFAEGEVLFCVESSGPVLDATFNPDGTILVTSDANGEVRILDSKNGELIKQLNLGVSVRDVNVSPDGTLLAMARDDARITLIKMSNYGFAGEFSVFGSLRVTAFSPDGKWFAAASDLGAITFWNLGTGQIVNGGAHRGEVFEIAFSPDSMKLISGAADDCAVLTSPSSGRQLLKVINEDRVTNAAFSPDGTWFVTSSDDFRIRVWDSNSGEERFRFLQDSVVKEVKISPDGAWIASTGSDRTVRVWSAANGAEMYQIPLDAEGRVLGFSPDAKHLVVGDADGNLSIWDISTLAINKGYLRFNEFVGNIAMSPNGDWFAASDKGQVWLLDPEEIPTRIGPFGKMIVDFKPDIVSTVEVNPKGDSFAVSTQDGQVVVISVDGGTRTFVSSGTEQSLAFSPDGNTLFMGGKNGLLQYRSLGEGENGTLWQGTSAIYSVAISAEGQIALGMDNKIILLNTDSTAPEKALNAPGRNQYVEFDPAGSVLVSSTTAGLTYFWQLKEGEFKQTFELSTGPVTSMSFSPNGQKLFLGETDQILIFDPSTGGELNRIRQKGEVADLTFTPDGSVLYSASLRTIQYFDLTAIKDISGEGILPSACSRLTQNLSASEWTFFFGEEEYRILCDSLPIP